MEKFKQLGLGSETLRTIQELKFTEPSEIQEKTIPIILTGKDVIGKSATGSGKTIAFISSILEKTKKGKGIQALVLTPTRELTQQVSGVLKKFAKKKELHVTEVYGGVSINNQIREIERSEIIVGTPGRILDHLGRRTLDLSKITVLVLDEADRMVDMGFLKDVENIIKQTPREKQTLLFCATTSADIEYIEKRYMHDPKYVVVDSYVDSGKLEQFYYDVPSNLKFSLLAHLLKNDSSRLVMIFCNTRQNVDMLTKNLRRFDLQISAIHGGMTQNHRNRIIQDFHSGRIRILVCSDVAARGLDIKDVSHIYNYDIPKTSTEYIHRIGRTARAGKEGQAISLVSQRDHENFRRVKLDDSLEIKSMPLPEFPQLQARFDFHEKRQGNFRDRKPHYGSRSEGGPSHGFKKKSFGGGPFRGRSNFNRPRREGFHGSSYGNRPNKFGGRFQQRNNRDRGYGGGNRNSRGRGGGSFQKRKFRRF
ncbi:DEAD/DEAH box helicase [Candidatus Pacearchaeota archaeon]|nr:DEAD/DEAH box helicase [Candidatus Pacearchaeota archaeon]